ncbi:3'(2'),5'-bisphosphate nucleotidase CysQ [Rhizobium sp. S-51]|jgi:myo-inositol-1(or 4)-monophosphatase|uniref:3'(2'),5'-bisphosphate nucleotidase CysQ n=1 Tax=Rhizobium terricola TaxID=2728849 RepID=A0A7Y0AW87_9HYPH|nr:3'(2'),5'-bisphosphate nucleotidase CysQ [Rhizobium terricola]NML74651.1 3'(2'),5'-bisphosphate nucleotidase CysQ [Rhizobium terricola]
MSAQPIFDWQADLALIAEAARAAGAVALGHFGQSPEVWWKNGGHSPVSAADYAANQCLEERLRSARPAYGWLSEETDDDPARLACETLFVVDPIDGTRAFINGRKTWCVSVAVVHGGRPVAGALVAPALDEEFLAVVDGPALKNGKPISVATHRPEERLKVATPQDIVAGFDAVIRDRIERVEHIPSLAYRLAMVADGRIDATLVKRNSHDWDLAAADLILERAGGRLVDLDGEALRYNRPEVSHGELCAAIEAELPDLLKHLLLAPRS